MIRKIKSYNMIPEAAKLSPLLSGKIGEYECLTGEEILGSNQNK